MGNRQKCGKLCGKSVENLPRRGMGPVRVGCRVWRGAGRLAGERRGAGRLAGERRGVGRLAGERRGGRWCGTRELRRARWLAFFPREKTLDKLCKSILDWK